MSQLPLAVKLDDSAVFSTFLAAGNASTVAYLKALGDNAKGPGAWLWGTSASGKSHLLQAVCERGPERAVFLPLQELKPVGPGVLEGMASTDCLCLDDVHAVAGEADWERGLLVLFEQARANQASMIVSASAPQREVGFALPDLASRFSLLPAFQLHALDDEGRLAALKLRARHRGLELPDDTARFLVTRTRRDMASLYAVLDTLDDAALVAKRRLTVPFVKAILER